MSCYLSNVLVGFVLPLFFPWASSSSFPTSDLRRIQPQEATWTTMKLHAKGHQHKSNNLNIYIPYVLQYMYTWPRNVGIHRIFILWNSQLLLIFVESLVNFLTYRTKYNICLPCDASSAPGHSWALAKLRRRSKNIVPPPVFCTYVLGFVVRPNHQGYHEGMGAN